MYMLFHGAGPLQRIKGFSFIPIFGLIQNFALIPEIDRPLL